MFHLMFSSFCDKRRVKAEPSIFLLVTSIRTRNTKAWTRTRTRNLLDSDSDSSPTHLDSDSRLADWTRLGLEETRTRCISDVRYNSANEPQLIQLI